MQPIPLSDLVYDPCERKFFYVHSGAAWKPGGVNAVLAYLNLPMKPTDWLKAHPSPGWKSQDTITHLTKEWAYDPVTQNFRYLPSGELWSDPMMVNSRFASIRVGGKRMRPATWLKREAMR